jgi:methylsterol monooxygenase/4-alpha-methyl-delta7-sterol-4alpha-methyl oxidase
MGLLFLGSRVHCFTYFFWLFWKIHIGTENHSGYDFPWSPIRVFPFVCGASFHDHHHSVNVGNYGLSTYTWDLMFETGQPYLDDFLERKVNMGDGKKIENKKIENKTPVEAEKVKAN